MLKQENVGAKKRSILRCGDGGVRSALCDYEDVATSSLSLSAMNSCNTPEARNTSAKSRPLFSSACLMSTVHRTSAANTRRPYPPSALPLKRCLAIVQTHRPHHPAPVVYEAPSIATTSKARKRSGGTTALSTTLHRGPW